MTSEIPPIVVLAAGGLTIKAFVAAITDLTKVCTILSAEQWDMLTRGAHEAVAQAREKKGDRNEQMVADYGELVIEILSSVRAFVEAKGDLGGEG